MMFDPLSFQSMLRDYGIKPKKGLGQNFLIEELTFRKIVEVSQGYRYRRGA